MISKLLVAGAAAAAVAGAPTYPSDIHPRSLSRLAPTDRASLGPEAQRVYDVIRMGQPAIPLTGPAPISMYSPGAAEPIHNLNQYLRRTVVGPRYFEMGARPTSGEAGCPVRGRESVGEGTGARLGGCRIWKK